MLDKKVKRVNRVRAKISGTAERPRLAVFRSLRHISAQLIDDIKGVTIVSASDIELKENTDKALAVGKLLAKKAAEKKISQAVFDRRANQYHGQVKALADGAREEGLQL